MFPFMSCDILRGKYRYYSFNVEKNIWLYPTFLCPFQPTPPPRKRRRGRKASDLGCCLTECCSQATKLLDWATLASSLWTSNPCMQDLIFLIRASKMQRQDPRLVASAVPLREPEDTQTVWAWKWSPGVLRPAQTHQLFPLQSQGQLGRTLELLQASANKKIH